MSVHPDRQDFVVEGDLLTLILQLFLKCSDEICAINAFLQEA